MKTSKPINPGGCRFCGADRQNHCQRWHGPGIGIGGFVDPTQEQIKERMIERRKKRLNPPVESYFECAYDSDKEVNISMKFGYPNAD